jgi:hypothetical protein
MCFHLISRWFLARLILRLRRIHSQLRLTFSAPYNPEDTMIHNHRCENLESYTTVDCWEHSNKPSDIILYRSILLHSSIYYNSYYHSLKCVSFLECFKDTQLSQLKKEDAVTTTCAGI